LQDVRALQTLARSNIYREANLLVTVIFPPRNLVPRFRVIPRAISGLYQGYFRVYLGSRQGYREIPGVLRTQRPYWHGAWHVLRGRRDDIAIWARVTLNVLTPTLAHLRATT